MLDEITQCMSFLFSEAHYEKEKRKEKRFC